MWMRVHLYFCFLWSWQDWGRYEGQVAAVLWSFIGQRFMTRSSISLEFEAAVLQVYLTVWVAADLPVLSAAYCLLSLCQLISSNAQMEIFTAIPSSIICKIATLLCRPPKYWNEQIRLCYYPQLICPGYWTKRTIRLCSRGKKKGLLYNSTREEPWVSHRLMCGHW